MTFGGMGVGEGEGGEGKVNGLGRMEEGGYHQLLQVAAHAVAIPIQSLPP